MEQRKLIKLGNSSFALALPKSWIDKSGLKKGENVFVEENGNGEIIIKAISKETGEERKAEINIEKKDSQTLRREILSNYVKGHNLFVIKGKKTREISDLIKKTIKEMIGMEMIKEDPEEIIAKDLFDVNEVDFTNFIRRIDNNIKEMLGILTDSLKKGKITNSQFADLNNADEDINKFHLLISRMLSRGVSNPSMLTKLKIDGIALVNNWWFSFNLERIGDEIKSSARVLKNNSLSEENCAVIAELLEGLKKIYSDSMESFYNNKIKKEDLLETVSKGKKIWEEFDALTLNKHPGVARISMKLKEIETCSYQNIKMIMGNKF